EPGVMKTPTIDAVTVPVKKIESRWRQAKVDSTETDDDDFDMPKPTRLIVNDATYEKVQDILSKNQLGLVVIRDELTGLLASLERHGQEGARQFYLTAWSGSSPYNIDRIERGSICLEHTCLSLLGAIQPMRLREYAGLNETAAT